MSYSGAIPENSTLEVNFNDFLKFHKATYLKNILLKDINSEKNQYLVNTIFSIKEVDQKTKIQKMKSNILGFLYD